MIRGRGSNTSAAMIHNVGDTCHPVNAAAEI